MDERLRFLPRLLDGEPMPEVCRDLGISRKTGYKIFDRYKEHGLEALSDCSRRPVRFANQLPAQLEARIVAIKRGKPRWGAGPSYHRPSAANGYIDEAPCRGALGRAGELNAIQLVDG